MTRKNRIWFIIGLIILFGGLDLAILLSHLSRYIGFLLMAVGLVILFFSGREILVAGPSDKKEGAKNLGARWIHMLTLRGSLKPFFPVFGAIVIIFVIVFNYSVADKVQPVNDEPLDFVIGEDYISWGNESVREGSETITVYFWGAGQTTPMPVELKYGTDFTVDYQNGIISLNESIRSDVTSMTIDYELVYFDFHIGSNDYITLILAGVLIAYNYIPRPYRVERDFALIFITLLFIIIAVPTTLYSLTSGEVDGDIVTNNSVTSILLTEPTATLSRLFGVEFREIGNNVLIFDGNGETVNLIIGLSCTGLYSVAIFISGFVSFVAVEYSRFDKRVVKLLALGIFLAWAANIIRMTIIVLVGRHKSAEAMRWTHNNIGELIFMIWVSLFWLLMFRQFNVWSDIESGKSRAGPVYAARRLKRKGGTGDGAEERGGRACPVCKGPLSSTIPAYRCECGQIYHRECTVGGGECVKCGKDFTKR